MEAHKKIISGEGLFLMDSGFPVAEWSVND